MESQRLDTEQPDELIIFRGADTDGENEEQQEDDEQQDDDASGAAPKGNESDDPQDGADEQVSRKEFNALMARMQAADRAKAAAEAKVKTFEDKDKTELERAAAERDEAKAETEALKESLNRSRIENAFASSKKYSWKNPETALKLADLSQVTIGEDGKVDGLEKALEALAKSDPYLLDTEEDPAPKSRTAPGGTPPKPDKNKARREELLKRYPALRGRG